MGFLLELSEVFKMPICKLCNKQNTLVKSHIFPEFMYRPLYDENHKIHFLTTGTNNIKKKLNKGVYEALFCKECDNNIIGKYENHAAKVLFGDGKTEIHIEKTELGLMVREVNYTLFKLFEISLLWRAAISTRPEIKRISLGPHAENMRNMLLNEDPGEVHQYGTVIYYFPKSSRDMKDLIMPPELSEKRIEGIRIYRAVFNGLLWTFLVSSHSEQYPFQNHLLSKEGVLPIINSGFFGERFVVELSRALS